MALNLTTLFTRLGKLFKSIILANQYEGTNLVPGITTIAGQYTSPLTAVPATLQANQKSYLTGVEAIGGDLQTAAQQTVIQMVQADTPSQAGSLASAVANVIYQMQQQAASVQASTVGTSTAVYPSGGSNTGDGVIVLSTLRGDGLAQEGIVAEVAPIVCTGDAQSGGATVNQEKFSFVGSADAGNIFSYQWPTGSGGSATLNAIDSTLNNAGNNLLTNSGFESFTGGNPNNWSVKVGVAGTDFAQDSANKYQGSSCLKLIGGTGTLTSIGQQFGISTGTLAAVKPLTSFAVNLRLKADVVPASGVLKIELLNGNGGSVINDQAGNANSLSITLSGITTSYVAHNIVFRLPRVLPSQVWLQIHLTTAIPGGSNVFIDGLAAGFLTPLYAGGPGCALFSGATPFIQGDGWYVTATNNRGGASNLATFQAMFDRFFGMRGLGLVLPSSGSPTIADSLMS